MLEASSSLSVQDQLRQRPPSVAAWLLNRGTRPCHLPCTRLLKKRLILSSRLKRRKCLYTAGLTPKAQAAKMCLIVRGCRADTGSEALSREC